MSVEQPPLYYFTNIQFNSSFYDTEAFTETQANALYLRKRTPDTATALETFNAGILSSSLDSLTPTSDLNIAATQTTGDINIANGAGRGGSAIVNISSGTNNSSAVNIMNGTNTNGTFSLRTGSGFGAISIGTGSNTGLISMGNAGCTTNLNSSTVNVARNSGGTNPTFIECNSTTTTNQLDFHCNNLTSIDYDARIAVGGGGAGAGGGTLEITALNTNISVNTSGAVNIMNNSASTGTVNIATGAGGSAKVNIGSGSSTGAIYIGNPTNAVNINSSALELGTATKALTVNTPIGINYVPTAITLSSQLGYNGLVPASITNIVGLTDSPVMSIVLPIGIWQLQAQIIFNITANGPVYAAISSTTPLIDNACCSSTTAVVTTYSFIALQRTVRITTSSPPISYYLTCRAITTATTLLAKTLEATRIG